MPVCERDFALVVGVNDYPGYRTLKGAIEDACDFERWLLDQAEGGGLVREHCKLVKSSPAPVRPIHYDIDDALTELKSAMGKKPGRRFYLYFSGHGLARRSVGADLCLAGWSEDRRNDALDSEHY